MSQTLTGSSTLVTTQQYQVNFHRKTNYRSENNMRNLFERGGKRREENQIYLKNIKGALSVVHRVAESKDSLGGILRLEDARARNDHVRPSNSSSTNGLLGKTTINLDVQSRELLSQCRYLDHQSWGGEGKGGKGERRRRKEKD